MTKAEAIAIASRKAHLMEIMGSVNGGPLRADRRNQLLAQAEAIRILIEIARKHEG